MSLSEKLSSYRKAKDLTVEELARILKVSKTTIRKWESGKTIPNLEQGIRLARTFGISLDSLALDDELCDVKDSSYIKGEIASNASKTGIVSNEVSMPRRNYRWQVIIVTLMALSVVIFASAWFLNKSHQAKEDGAVILINTPTISSTTDPLTNSISPAINVTESPKPITLITTEGYGNNPDNLSSMFTGGFAVCCEDRIYFTSNGQNGIFSMKMDGSDIKNFREGYFFGLNSIDDCLFFTDGQNLYRVDSDDTEYEYAVKNFRVQYLCYYNGSLYFAGQNNEGIPVQQMCRIGSDFQKKEALFDFAVKPDSIHVSGNCVYYRDSSLEDAGVFESNWLTGETRKITTIPTNTVNAYGGYIYSSGAGNYIMTTSLETMKSKTMQNSTGMTLERVFENGLVYYNLNGPYDNGIWAYDLKNEMKTNIWSNPNSNFSINIAGGWIFAKTYIGEIYAIKLPNGKAQLLIDENLSLTTDNADYWKQTVISWKDKNVEFCIRMAINKPEGDITYGEANQIKELIFFENAICSTTEIHNANGHYTGENSGYVVYNEIQYPFRTFNTLYDFCYFTGLEKLILQNCRMKGNLSSLASLDQLATLSFGTSGTFRYSKGAFSQLKQVKQLEIAEYGQDVDLSCVEGMISLERLDIGTPVSDTSALVKLNNLKLVVFEDKVTKEAYKYLMENRPDIEIIASYVN